MSRLAAPLSEPVQTCGITQHLSAESHVSSSASQLNGKSLLVRATGKFYTHEIIGRQLAKGVANAFGGKCPSELRIVEPFCGDGRLVSWLLEELASRCRRRKVVIDLWDVDEAALPTALANVTATAARLRIDADVSVTSGDSFLLAAERFGHYHLCVTNPPWENLKPDRRELAAMGETAAEQYVELLRERDSQLQKLFPRSQPAKKYSGWGTNLARCGVEVATRLIAPSGVVGVVSPSSLLADQMSEQLRRWLFTEHAVSAIDYYVAEARLFDKVDQPCVTVVAAAGIEATAPPEFSICDKHHVRTASHFSHEEWEKIASNHYVVPLEFGRELVGQESLWASLPRFEDLERDEDAPLWAGREIDETNYESYLGDSGDYLFVKGRMLQRYGVVEQPTRFVISSGPRVPKSANFARVAWRDVSRPSQKRRMHAAIIPAGWAAGNSLHVAYFEDGDEQRLKALLAVMNSLVFEAQARSLLATAHVSLGIVRRVAIPSLRDEAVVEALAAMVDRRAAGDEATELAIEVAVAKLYGADKEQFGKVIASFPKIEPEERNALLAAWSDNAMAVKSTKASNIATQVVIPNHFAPTLSELDLQMVRAVPPGGNWKDIPTSVPSQRLEQIRKSYAAGEGSRSTYYGRLRADAPSYTISTYFSRPGNGCHAHYDFAGGQHRTISQREAARLQSFPDNFVFQGSKTAINTQIGNAVPPLLAYQIAKSIPFRGQFVDLFSGAGGMGLGFLWAGWEPIVANDVEDVFLETYRANIHDSVVAGSIREDAVIEEIIARGTEAKRKRPKLPLFVLGGPPCQGFSTAGNKRSMDDDRNWLFRQYKTVVQKLDPDGFVFENVTGLLSMEGGKVFTMIRGELEGLINPLAVWQLRAELYAVPQRRTRVIIVGDKSGKTPIEPPTQTTRLPETGATLFDTLPPWITVEQALADLPPLVPGEDGSGKDYTADPSHPYQQLMRSLITAEQYLEEIAADRPVVAKPPQQPRARNGRAST